MRSGEAWRPAVSAAAATTGICIASGRQMSLFFAQLQGASWLSAAVSSALFGALYAIIASYARKTGERSFFRLCMRALPGGAGKAAAVLYGLLMAAVSAAMLAESGRMAALMLPLRNAYWMGVLLSLGLACLRCVRGSDGWGMIAPAACILFYAALAADPRPVRIFGNYRTELKLSGSVGAALLLGAMHGALSASMAAHDACSDGWRRPAAAALAAGGGMFALLCTANEALLRGGERLLAQSLPEVLLAARWGKNGFYACVSVKWMCALATLTAAMRALLGKRVKRRES